MPASSKCSSCMNAFDCEAHFPMNCPCGRYSICEQCSIESLGWWKSYCCQSVRLEKDATFSKLAEERKKFEAVIAEQKRKLKIAEELNMEKDTKIAELQEDQENSCGVKCVKVICNECGVVNDERKFSICRACTKEYDKIDILNCGTLSEAKLRSFALCEFCIKYYHEGHEHMDYFPILASINHQTQVMATSIIQSKLDKASKEIRKKMENMLKSLEKAKKVANEMTENVRIAKNSGNQKVLSDLITDCYRKIIYETETITQKQKIGLGFDIGKLLEELKAKHKKMEFEELEYAYCTEELDRFKIGTDALKWPENDSQKIPSDPSAAMWNGLLEQQRFVQNIESRSESQFFKAKQGAFNQMHMMQAELMAKKNSTPVVDNIEAAIDVPKCPENDCQKQSGVQNGQPVDLWNILQDSENLMDIAEFDRQCINHFKNKGNQKSENLKFNQGFGGLKADNGTLESNKSLVEMLFGMNCNVPSTSAASQRNDKDSEGFDPVANSLANQFSNFGVNCTVPSTSAATQCNDKDSEDGSGSEASFEKI